MWLICMWAEEPLLTATIANRVIPAHCLGSGGWAAVERKVAGEEPVLVG